MFFVHEKVRFLENVADETSAIRRTCLVASDVKVKATKRYQLHSSHSNTSVCVCVVYIIGNNLYQAESLREGIRIYKLYYNKYQ